MKIFYVFGGLLTLLSIFSCAEIPSTSTENFEGRKHVPLNLTDLPAELLHIIGLYLGQPLGFLNKEMNQAFSAFPTKDCFKSVFPDITELVTNDVERNEKELAYLLPLRKFYNSNFFVEALQYELIEGTFIKKLAPHLINYLHRLNCLEYFVLVKFLITHKRFDIIFQDDAKLFIDNASRILSRSELIEGLQKYILSKQENMVYIQNYFYSLNILNLEGSKNFRYWIFSVFALNLPDILFNFMDYVHTECTFNKRIPDSIWTQMFIPRKLYPEVFDRINFLINRFYTEIQFKRKYFYYRI